MLALCATDGASRDGIAKGLAWLARSQDAERVVAGQSVNSTSSRARTFMTDAATAYAAGDRDRDVRRAGMIAPPLRVATLSGNVVRTRSMRFLFLLLSLACACTARQPERAAVSANEAVRQTTYGHVSQGPAVSPSENPALGIDAYDGKVMRVEGTVAAVCPNRGCWMDIAGSDGTTIRIKVKDGEVVFPRTATGKRVRSPKAWW